MYDLTESWLKPAHLERVFWDIRDAISSRKDFLSGIMESGTQENILILKLKYLSKDYDSTTYSQWVQKKKKERKST